MSCGGLITDIDQPQMKSFIAVSSPKAMLVPDHGDPYFAPPP